MIIIWAMMFSWLTIPACIRPGPAGFALVVVCLGQPMSIVDGTIVNVALTRRR